MKQPTARGRPPVEPEIIPPQRDGPPMARAHIRIVRLGPVSAALLALGIGAVSALLLIVLLGAFLIWIPVVGLIVAAAIISGVLKGHFRRG